MKPTVDERAAKAWAELSAHATARLKGRPRAERDRLQRAHYDGQAWLLYEALEKYEDVHPKGALCLAAALKAARESVGAVS